MSQLSLSNLVKTAAVAPVNAPKPQMRPSLREDAGEGEVGPHVAGGDLDVEAEALVAEPGDLAVHVHVQHELGTDVLDRLGGVPGGVEGGGTRVGGG